MDYAWQGQEKYISASNYKLLNSTWVFKRTLGMRRGQHRCHCNE
jgi:hypothetical protein